MEDPTLPMPFGEKSVIFALSATVSTISLHHIGKLQVLPFIVTLYATCCAISDLKRRIFGSPRPNFSQILALASKRVSDAERRIRNAQAHRVRFRLYSMAMMFPLYLGWFGVYLRRSLVVEFFYAIFTVFARFITSLISGASFIPAIKELFHSIRQFPLSAFLKLTNANDVLHIAIGVGIFFAVCLADYFLMLGERGAVASADKSKKYLSDLLQEVGKANSLLLVPSVQAKSEKALVNATPKVSSNDKTPPRSIDGKDNSENQGSPGSKTPHSNAGSGGTRESRMATPVEQRDDDNVIVEPSIATHDSHRTSVHETSRIVRSSSPLRREYRDVDHGLDVGEDIGTNDHYFSQEEEQQQEEPNAFSHEIEPPLTRARRRRRQMGDL